MVTQWACKNFDELKPRELYAILHLRNEVFVVEQNCVYQDADNKDIYGHHLMGWNNHKLVAYARILPSGLGFDEVSIGRIVTSPSVRRTGLGKILMQKSIEQTYILYGKVPIRIGAQLYLKHFYESFQFRQAGALYLEDDIEHIEMLLSNSSGNIP
jgi:ElaA protein